MYSDNPSHQAQSDANAPYIDNDIEADTSSSHETDSAYGSDDTGSVTASVTSSIFAYREENGRTYHAYKDGQYAYPNDDQEQDRLDLQHNLFLMSLGNKLHIAPIKGDIHNVLDLATGTGLWAIDFGDEHPDARVLGTDLSPIQPTNVPPNVEFEVDDANEPWTFNRKFDYIHVRQHHCAINEKHLFREAMEHLTPGGWIEMQELAFPLGCSDGTVTKEDAVQEWSDLMLKASQMVKQDLENAKNYAEWMREAGFTNVTATMQKWAGNPWPKNKTEKLRGLWMMQNNLDGLHGFTMALFTRIHGWRPEEVEVFLAKVRKDIQDRGKHFWWPVWFVTGQKPER